MNGYDFQDEIIVEEREKRKREKERDDYDDIVSLNILYFLQVFLTSIVYFSRRSLV